MSGAGGEIRTPKTQGLSLICIPVPSHPQTRKQAVHCCGCPLFANNYFPSRRGWAYQPDACHLLLQFFSHMGMLLISVGFEPTLARRRVPPLDHEIISGHNYRSQACAPARKTVGYGQTRGPRTGFEPAISPQGRCTHPECSRGHK